jgi:hypothetical protein
MSIQILPVQEADLPDLVHVYVAAFENDPIVGRLKAGLSESVRFQKILAYFRRLYAGTDVYGARFFKAVEGDDDGDGNGDKGYVHVHVLFFLPFRCYLKMEGESIIFFAASSIKY